MTAPSTWQLTVKPERDPAHTIKMFKISHQMTVARAVHRYLVSMKERKLSKNYITNTRLILRTLEKSYGDWLTRDLNQKQVGVYLGKLFKKVEPNTYAHYSRTLRLFFDFCRERQYVLYNYVNEIDYKFHKGRMFFDTHQLDLIFKALEPGELRDACLVLYHTGIRSRELDKIVGPDFINSLLMLTDRRVACPNHILTVVQRRRLFNSERVGEAFTAFMKQFDFEGDLRYFRNSYVLRSHYAGMPVALVRNQIGFVNDKDVEDKIDRLKSGPQSLYLFINKHPFQDYF